MTQVKAKPKTSSWFTTANPKLALAEIGLELDTGKFKMGDGVSYWNDLSYVGESIPGVQILRGPFDFSYNTPGLANGLTFYTLQPGEFLIDAFMAVIIPWNGTTPHGDFGAVPWDSTHNDTGYFGFCGATIDMSNSYTVDDNDSLGNVIDGLQALSQFESLIKAWGQLKVPAISGNHAQQDLVMIQNNPFTQSLPVLCDIEQPLSVAVTQTGIAGDPAPGATQGSAKIWITTAQPVPFS